MTQLTRKLDVRLPADMREALDDLAQQRTQASKTKVKASDILREAVAQYLANEAHINVSTEVDRGGNRRKLA